MKYVTPLNPGETYYIFGRSMGQERLFNDERNYLYFLERYAKYILPFATTLSYSLLPNQFHFVVAFDSDKTINDNFDLRKDGPISSFISNEFRKLFCSYVMGFNKDIDRSGGLFCSPFRRQLINDNAYLLSLIKHLHLLPVQLGLCEKPEQWKFSSYPFIANRAACLADSAKVLSHFSSLDDFLLFHESPTELKIKYPLPASHIIKFAA